VDTERGDYKAHIFCHCPLVSGQYNGKPEQVSTGTQPGTCPHSKSHSPGVSEAGPLPTPTSHCVHVSSAEPYGYVPTGKQACRQVG
jgi:hypothetical protein